MTSKELPNVNVVIIGHVDSGKSTTCGQLVAGLGKIDKRLLEKYEKEATEMGKGSFKWAWVMDNLKAERERGITINNSLNEIYTKNRKITIIDAPGHRDFIKNMISGASQADAAILMVSGNKGEFEAGISESGQTKEHAMLAQTLGLKQFIICINKMDMTMGEESEFNEKRFEEIKDYMTDFLVKLNYKKETLKFVPISGFYGDNVIEKSTRCGWYKEGTLHDCLDRLVVPKRPTTKPLRLPVQNKYKIAGIGLVTSGRMETGTLKPGAQVTFMPGNIKTEVKSIEMHHAALAEALPGFNIGFNVKNVPFNDVKKGMVVGEQKNEPPRVCKGFYARIIVMNHRNEIKVGYSPQVHIHAAHGTCKIAEIQNLFDRRTGKVIDDKPTCIKKEQGATVLLIPEKPMVVETFKNFAPLGRFSIRDSKLTVAVGVITEVLYE